ncbi:prevent-host-death family protein [Xenococcus sp. PCC 7305]|nr:prevent-host-death family protein [Xenococcus sp. PCC 7305]
MYFFIMESVNYTEFRRNLANYLDKVENDRVPMIVTRSNNRRSVVISYDDYMENEATLHLMSSQENIRVINEAISELEAGGGIEVEI